MRLSADGAGACIGAVRHAPSRHAIWLRNVHGRHALGVRRPTVTLVLNDLADAAIISTSRGSVRIVDRAKLEARACDCYRRVSEVYDADAPPESKLVAGASIS